MDTESQVSDEGADTESLRSATSSPARIPEWVLEETASEGSVSSTPRAGHVVPIPFSSRAMGAAGP